MNDHCHCDLPTGTPHDCAQERQTDGAISFVDRGEFETAARVIVCEACLRASCWHGAAECEDWFRSGVVRLTVAELDRLGREHPSHYEAQAARAARLPSEEMAAE